MLAECQGSKWTTKLLTSPTWKTKTLSVLPALRRNYWLAVTSPSGLWDHDRSSLSEYEPEVASNAFEQPIWKRRRGSAEGERLRGWLRRVIRGRPLRTISIMALTSRRLAYTSAWVKSPGQPSLTHPPLAFSIFHSEAVAFAISQWSFFLFSCLARNLPSLGLRRRKGYIAGCAWFRAPALC